MNIPPSNYHLLLPLILLIPVLVAPLLKRDSAATAIVSIISILACSIGTLIKIFFVIIHRDLNAIHYKIKWIEIADFHLNLSYLIDFRSLAMGGLVLFISLAVNIYSLGYMKNDNRKNIYFGNLAFFTFSMLGLVISGNLLITFMFWELVGYCSWRLIGFWNNRPEAIRAANTAFIINRLADMGFIIGLAIIWSNHHTLDISQLSSISPLAYGCIFLGVMGKSAQLPFSGWLSSAMEGPTPVSAIMHSATMVAAGVFLLYRLSPIPSEVLPLIAITGSITCLAGGIMALTQFDLKRILAFSTISQLGLMILCFGVGAEHHGMGHLFAHAFFKAGLFLFAGMIIALLHKHHSEKDCQDIRNMGGLLKSHPTLAYIGIYLLAALVGFPFTPGFHSKETILKFVSDNLNLSDVHLVVAIVCWLSVPLTSLYAFRIFWYVFTGSDKKMHGKTNNFMYLGIFLPLVISVIITLFIHLVVPEMWLRSSEVIFSIFLSSMAFAMGYFFLSEKARWCFG